MFIHLLVAEFWKYITVYSTSFSNRWKLKKTTTIKQCKPEYIKHADHIAKIQRSTSAYKKCESYLIKQHIKIQRKHSQHETWSTSKSRIHKTSSPHMTHHFLYERHIISCMWNKAVGHPAGASERRSSKLSRDEEETQTSSTLWNHSLGLSGRELRQFNTNNHIGHFHNLFPSSVGRFQNLVMIKQ